MPGNPKKYGFTLLEVIVVIGILGMVIIAVGMFVSQGYKINAFGQEQNQAIKEAQKGVSTMVKEIREAGYGDDGSAPFYLADDFELIYFSDIDKDVATERVRYFLDGTNFNKGTIEATGSPLEYLEVNEEIITLSRYVRNESDPIFTYYNGDYPGDTIYNPLATPADLTEIKLVHVHLKINVDPSRAPIDYNLESDAHVRNLKENL